MTRAPLIMYAVAGVLGLGGIVVATRPARSDGAVYARRIAATMLIALAITLAFYASAMDSWGAGGVSGALLLGIVSLICVTDLLVALRFSRMADRAESEVGAAPKPSQIDPVAARRFARVMFVAAPLMWLFLAALSFGLIPTDGITPIKF